MTDSKKTNPNAHSIPPSELAKNRPAIRQPGYSDKNVLKNELANTGREQEWEKDMMEPHPPVRRDLKRNE